MTYIVRDLNINDYNNYLELMYEFTNYRYNISYENYENYLNETNNIIKILVICLDNKIIGAGTIFKINKLHNNPIGQIEDVIINNEFRGKGLGKKIIEKLIIIGLDEFKCYKIILNCLEKNIDFYKKCNFEVVGVEMKYV